MITTWKLPSSNVYHGLNNALGIGVHEKHCQVLPTQMVPISALAHGLIIHVLLPIAGKMVFILKRGPGRSWDKDMCLFQRPPVSGCFGSDRPCRSVALPPSSSKVQVLSIVCPVCLNGDNLYPQGHHWHHKGPRTVWPRVCQQTNRWGSLDFRRRDLYHT